MNASTIGTTGTTGTTGITGGNRDPVQSEIGRGTPPARTPEDLPETDLQPEQAPVRDTPEAQPPGSQPRTP
jgi:hypothetical protein